MVQYIKATSIYHIFARILPYSCTIEQPSHITGLVHRSCSAAPESSHALPRPPPRWARAAAQLPPRARSPPACSSRHWSFCSWLEGGAAAAARRRPCRSQQRRSGGGGGDRQRANLCSTHAQAGGWHVCVLGTGIAEGRHLIVGEHLSVAAAAANEVGVHLHPHLRGRIKKSVGIGPIRPLGSCLLTATLLARA